MPKPARPRNRYLIDGITATLTAHHRRLGAAAGVSRQHAAKRIANGMDPAEALTKPGNPVPVPEHPWRQLRTPSAAERAERARRKARP